jgi:hypothetical protein
MKQLSTFLSHHKKAVALTAALLVTGAFFRWEEKEVIETETGKLVSVREGIALPWQYCGPRMPSGTTRINFHVRQWMCYGLVRVEATGQTVAKI